MKSAPGIHDIVPEDLRPPPPPEPLEQEDYPDVRYWTQQEWSKYVDREKEMGRTYSSMGWLNDENGAEIGEEVIKKMSLEAYGIFSNFYYLRLDPNTWRLRQPEVAAFFCNTMRTKFPILNLANGDWKANMFATTRYPNWNRHHRATGHLKRKYPSLRSSGVGEPNDSHQSKKKQKKKAAKVIDISDDDGTSAASHSSTSHTAHSFSMAPRQKPPHSSTSMEIMSGKHKPRPRRRPQHRDNADATPAASSDSGDIPAPLSTNKQNLLPSVSITAAASVASACAIDAPTSSVQPCANASASSPTPAGVATGTSATTILGTNLGFAGPCTSSSTGSTPNDSTTPPSAILAQDVQPPTATTSTNPPPATTETPTTTSPQPSSPALSSVNNSGTLALFNDLPIPEPVQQVPLQTTSLNTTTATTAVSETWKKGKIMVPQANSVTARNLFAFDHMQQHPTTTVTEFGRIWKDLDKDTRDKYDAMSKEKNIEKKKAQKLPK